MGMHYKKKGMRMAAPILLWKHSQHVLKDVGIDLSRLADIEGWGFLGNVVLSEEQRERVLAQLPDEHFLSSSTLLWRALACSQTSMSKNCEPQRLLEDRHPSHSCRDRETSKPTARNKEPARHASLNTHHGRGKAKPTPRMKKRSRMSQTRTMKRALKKYSSRNLMNLALGNARD